MKTFESLEDVAREVHRKDLERQIAKERLKLRINSIGKELSSGIRPSELSELAGNYLGRFIQNTLKNK